MVDPGVPDPPEDASGRARRYPSTIGGVFYLVVLAVTLVGLGVAGAGAWRQGVSWIGSGLCFAAAVRVVLRGEDAGMLAVRRKLTDAVLLGGVGAALIFLAQSIPDQPG